MSDSEQAFDIGTVISDAKSIVFNPIGFYKAMPQTGGLVNPVIFVLVMALISGVILSFYSLFQSSFGGFGLGAIITFPLFGLIGSFIVAAILFVIWKLMGSEKNYEVAYRCVAYTFVITPIVAVISFIPYIPGVIQTLWGAFLMYVASKEVHGVKEQTAKIVFGVLAAISVLWGVGSERAVRHLTAKFEQASDGINIKDFENMTPEEIGENAGKLLHGFTKALEEANKNK